MNKIMIVMILLIKCSSIKSQGLSRTKMSKREFQGLSRPWKRTVKIPRVFKGFQDGMNHVFYYGFCTFLHCCHHFNPSLCCVTTFQLSYSSVSKPCCLLECYPNRVALVEVQLYWLYQDSIILSKEGHKINSFPAALNKGSHLRNDIW